MTDNPEHHKLLALEKEVLTKAQNVEVVYALDRRKKLPQGMELCFSHAVEEMLKDRNAYHLYFKYFQVLSSRYNLNILLELTGSFVNFVSKLDDASDAEIRKQVVSIGFSLFDFVCQAGMFVRAEGIILEVMRFAFIVTWCVISFCCVVLGVFICCLFYPLARVTDLLGFPTM